MGSRFGRDRGSVGIEVRSGSRFGETSGIERDGIDEKERAKWKS
jgi:hypothetical protein